MATYKESLARQLAEDLGLRLKALGVATGVDSSGNPTVSVGAMTAGSQSAFVRVLDQASIQVDSLGLPQRSFGPHVVQIVLETSTIATVALMTEANKLKLVGELLKHGAKVELYLTANLTAPSVAGIAAGNLIATWDHLYQPLTASM